MAESLRKSPRGPWRGLALIVVLLAVSVAAVPLASPAAAQGAAQAAPGVGNVPEGWEVSPEPVTDWGVATLLPSSTLEFDSLVWDFAELDGVVYVAGRFGDVTDGWRRPLTAQPYLAAFDADTGVYLPGFAPVLDGPAIALESDGSRLYVGGEFTSVDGVQTGPLAAVDPLSGALDPSWAPNLSWDNGTAVVMDLEIANDSLYVGGNFLRSGSTLTPRLAKLSLTDARHDPAFQAVVSGARAWSIELSPDATRLYLGGYFQVVNGQPVTWFGALDAFDGSLVPGVTQGTAAGMPQCCDQNVFDIATFGDRVYVARESHLLEVLDATDLSRIGYYVTNFGGGDYQATEVIGDRLYAGGHYWANQAYDTRAITTNRGTQWTNYNIEMLSSPTQRHAIWTSAYHAATGADLPDFLLDLSAASGIWAIHGSENGRLWLGGDITRAGSGWSGGFAVFEVADVTDRGADLATGATATASSVDGSYGPQYAVDAHLAGQVRHDGVHANFAQTQVEDDPWIEVDLGAVHDLGVLRLFERAVGNGNGLSQGTIFVSDVPFTSTDPQATAAQPGVSAYDTGRIYRWTEYEINRTGRYVRVQLPGNGRRITADCIEIYEAVGGLPTLPAPGFVESTRQERFKIVLHYGLVEGADHYEILRDGAVVATDDNAWFVDVGLSEGTAYHYEVRAVAADGTPGEAAALDVSTIGTTLEAPTLRITRVERRKVVVNYGLVDGADHYEILVDGAVVGIDSDRWFVIDDLDPATTYAISVRAVSGRALGPAATTVETTLP